MTTEPRAIHSIANTLVMGLEDEFEIEIADSVCETWNAVSDAISYIQGAVTP